MEATQRVPAERPYTVGLHVVHEKECHECQGEGSLHYEECRNGHPGACDCAAHEWDEVCPTCEGVRIVMDGECCCETCCALFEQLEEESA